MMSCLTYLCNLIFVCSIYMSITAGYVDDSAIQDAMTSAGVYYSYDQTFNIYEKHIRPLKNNDPADVVIDSLFSEFDSRIRHHFFRAEEKICISVEGMLFGLRATFAWRLGKVISGFVMQNPPKEIKKLRLNTTKYSVQNNVFFSLANYVVSSNAVKVLGRKHVIIIKYWLYQAALTIARLYRTSIPPRGASVYRWPRDLCKPDIVFFINSPTEPVDTGLRLRYHSIKPILFEIFQRFDIKVIVLNLTTTLDDMVVEAVAAIRTHVVNKKLKTLVDHRKLRTEFSDISEDFSY